MRLEVSILTYILLGYATGLRELLKAAQNIRNSHGNSRLLRCCQTDFCKNRYINPGITATPMPICMVGPFRVFYNFTQAADNFHAQKTKKALPAAEPFAARLAPRAELRQAEV